MKNVLALWSGGLDSTYMIYKYLKAGHTVNCIYFELMNNPVKTKMELAAIHAMVQPMHTQFPNFHYNGVCGRAEVHLLDGDIQFQQLPFWLLAILLSVNKSTSEVAMGYVMNDDAISYMTDIRRIYNAYQPMFAFKLPKLVFPIHKVQKFVERNELPQEIVDQCVWCENPSEVDGKFKPCTKCHSCIRYYQLFPEPVEYGELMIPEGECIEGVKVSIGKHITNWN